MSLARPPVRALVRALVAALWVFLLSACATSTSAEVQPAAPAQAPAAREPVEVRASAELVEVGDSVPPDPEVLAFLEPQAVQVRARAGRVVGTLTGPLKRGKPESTLGNFVTDAMREGMGRFTGKAPDVCFTNSGGLRRDLDGGPVTEGVLVELMPFDNSVIVFEADATQLRSILGRLAERGDPASGVRYVRASGKARDITVGGKPIDPKRVYTLCTNDYVFEGGGQYPFEGVSNVSYTGVLLRDALIQTFELEASKQKSIAPVLDGRVKESR